jgi:hypothetical protein
MLGGHGLWMKIMDGRVSAVIDGVHGGTRGKPSRGVVLAVTVRTDQRCHHLERGGYYG